MPLNAQRDFVFYPMPVLCQRNRRTVTLFDLLIGASS